MKMLSRIASIINNNFVCQLGFIPIDYRIDAAISIVDSVVIRDLDRFKSLLLSVNLDTLVVSPDNTLEQHNDFFKTLRYKLLVLCQCSQYLDPVKYILPNKCNINYIQRMIGKEVTDNMVRLYISKYGADKLKFGPLQDRVKYITYRDAVDISEFSLREVIAYCNTRISEELPADHIEYIHKVFLTNYKTETIECVYLLHALLNNHIDISPDIIQEVIDAYPGSMTTVFIHINLYIDAVENSPIDIDNDFISLLNSDCNNIVYRIIELILPRISINSCYQLFIGINIKHISLLKLLVSKCDEYCQTFIMHMLRVDHLVKSMGSDKNECLATIQKIAMLDKVDIVIRQQIINEISGSLSSIVINVE